MIGILRR